MGVTNDANYTQVRQPHLHDGKQVQLLDSCPHAHNF
jgi:hypothetical protein